MRWLKLTIPALLAGLLGVTWIQSLGTIQPQVDIGALALGLATGAVTTYILATQWRASRPDLAFGDEVFVLSYPDKLVVLATVTFHNPGTQHVLVRMCSAKLDASELSWEGAHELHTSRAVVPSRIDGSPEWISTEAWERRGPPVPIFLPGGAVETTTFELVGACAPLKERHESYRLDLRLEVRAAAQWPFGARTYPQSLLGTFRSRREPSLENGPGRGQVTAKVELWRV